MIRKTLKIMKLIVTNTFFIKLIAVIFSIKIILLYIELSENISKNALYYKLLIVFLPLFFWLLDSYFGYKKRIFSEINKQKELIFLEVEKKDELTFKIKKVTHIKKFVISFLSIFKLSIYIPILFFAIIFSGFLFNNMSNSDLGGIAFSLIITIGYIIWPLGFFYCLILILGINKIYCQIKNQKLFSLKKKER
ncbi:hypothetical protein QEJ31_00035 [Pigmentibacter sp. JX0631]|uniref:hypothetical protein n=1 Tax=Pigmentibacter sp. JX0631 TaxID=2976982 RepID=UPI002468B17C|nr:hypothetical protein [Pigmentibacter sp. JX0631]WGL59990.1 hypothetical protein QEJ31_00035 [Pigmentibacter sp. JX0631]